MAHREDHADGAWTLAKVEIPEEHENALNEIGSRLRFSEDGGMLRGWIMHFKNVALESVPVEAILQQRKLIDNLASIAAAGSHGCEIARAAVGALHALAERTKGALCESMDEELGFQSQSGRKELRVTDTFHSIAGRVIPLLGSSSLHACASSFAWEALPILLGQSYQAEWAVELLPLFDATLQRLEKLSGASVRVCRHGALRLCVEVLRFAGANWDRSNDELVGRLEASAEDEDIRRNHPVLYSSVRDILARLANSPRRAALQEADDAERALEHFHEAADEGDFPRMASLIPNVAPALACEPGGAMLAARCAEACCRTVGMGDLAVIVCSSDEHISFAALSSCAEFLEGAVESTRSSFASRYGEAIAQATLLCANDRRSSPLSRILACIGSHLPEEQADACLAAVWDACDEAAVVLRRRISSGMQCADDVMKQDIRQLFSLDSRWRSTIIQGQQFGDLFATLISDGRSVPDIHRKQYRSHLKKNEVERLMAVICSETVEISVRRVALEQLRTIVGDADVTEVLLRHDFLRTLWLLATSEEGQFSLREASLALLAMLADASQSARRWLEKNLSYVALGCLRFATMGNESDRAYVALLLGNLCLRTDGDAKDDRPKPTIWPALHCKYWIPFAHSSVKTHSGNWSAPAGHVERILTKRRGLSNDCGPTVTEDAEAGVQAFSDAKCHSEAHSALDRLTSLAANGESGKRAVSTVSWKPLWRVLGTPPRTAADAELWRRTAHLIVTCTEEEDTPDENILESFMLIGRCLGHFIASSTPLSKDDTVRPALKHPLAHHKVNGGTSKNIETDGWDLVQDALWALQAQLQACQNARRSSEMVSKAVLALKNNDATKGEVLSSLAADPCTEYASRMLAVRCLSEAVNAARARGMFAEAEWICSCHETDAAQLVALGLRISAPLDGIALAHAEMAFLECSACCGSQSGLSAFSKGTIKSAAQMLQHPYARLRLQVAKFLATVEGGDGSEAVQPAMDRARDEQECSRIRAQSLRLVVNVAKNSRDFTMAPTLDGESLVSLRSLKAIVNLGKSGSTALVRGVSALLRELSVAVPGRVNDVVSQSCGWELLVEAVVRQKLWDEAEGAEKSGSSVKTLMTSLGRTKEVDEIITEQCCAVANVSELFLLQCSNSEELVDYFMWRSEILTLLAEHVYRETRHGKGKAGGEDRMFASSFLFMAFMFQDLGIGGTLPRGMISVLKKGAHACAGVLNQECYHEALSAACKLLTAIFPHEEALAQGESNALIDDHLGAQLCRDLLAHYARCGFSLLEGGLCTFVRLMNGCLPLGTSRAASEEACAALRCVLAYNGGAKDAAVEAKLPATVVKRARDAHNLMTLEAEAGAGDREGAADAEPASIPGGHRRDFFEALTILKHLAYGPSGTPQEGPAVRAREELIRSGLLATITQAWPKGSNLRAELHEVLGLVSNVVANCEAAQAEMSKLSGSTSGGATRGSIIHRVGKIASKPGQPLPLLELAVNCLRTFALAPRTQSIIFRGQFIPDALREVRELSKKRSYGKCTIWLAFLADCAGSSGGMRKLLESSSPNALVDMLMQLSECRNEETSQEALLVVHNMSMHAEGKTTVGSHQRLVELLVRVAGSSHPGRATWANAYAATAIWWLLYGWQKVKGMLGKGAMLSELRRAQSQLEQGAFTEGGSEWVTALAVQACCELCGCDSDGR